jgi:hypothetical protein
MGLLVVQANVSRQTYPIVGRLIAFSLDAVSQASLLSAEA